MVTKAAGFVVYRVVSLEIQFLLMQATYGNHHWTPPKGHLEEGESEYEAALRETVEETGIQTFDLRILGILKKTLEYNVKGTKKVVTYWLAELINPNTTIKLSAEHQAYQWLPLDKACKLSGFQDMRELLEDCQKVIETK